MGNSVKKRFIGDYLTVDLKIPCKEYFYCKNGKKYFCKNLEGIGANYDGSLQNIVLYLKPKLILFQV